MALLVGFVAGLTLGGVCLLTAIIRRAVTMLSSRDE